MRQRQSVEVAVASELDNRYDCCAYLLDEIALVGSPQSERGSNVWDAVTRADSHGKPDGCTYHTVKDPKMVSVLCGPFAISL